MLGTENDPDVMEQGSAVTVVQEPTREELISDAAQILVSENEVLVGDELTEEPMPQMDFNSNLVEFIAEDVLQKLASDLMSSIQSDKQSRSEWEKTYKEGLTYHDAISGKYFTRDSNAPGGDGVPQGFVEIQINK